MVETIVDYIVELFKDNVPKELIVFVISMLPIVELRGGIPIGVGMGLDFWTCYLVCVVGNLLPVPFLILFSKKVLI